MIGDCGVSFAMLTDIGFDANPDGEWKVRYINSGSGWVKIDVLTSDRYYRQ